LKELARKVKPGIGRTRLGQRIFECVFTIGTRSAQSIMASKKNEEKVSQYCYQHRETTVMDAVKNVLGFDK
jgi:hypothetical protein